MQDLDVSKLHFSSKMPMNNGGYMCYVNNKDAGTGKFYIQTPIMKVPFGISKTNPFGSTNPEAQPKTNLLLSFGKSRDPDVAICHEKLKELDKFMHDSAVANSVDWFGKKSSMEVLEEKYNPCVRSPNKPPDNGKQPFPDTLSLKIYCRGSGDNIVPSDELKLFEWDVENDNCKQVNVSTIWDVIERQCEVQVIFRVNMLYFVGKQSWGLTLKAETIRYIPMSMHPTGAAQFISTALNVKEEADGSEEGEIEEFEEVEEGEEYV
jgi:hypothetical protein